MSRKVWSVNPSFRNSPLFLAFMFDFGKKLEMHRSATSIFLPQIVSDEDAEEQRGRILKSLSKRLDGGRWRIGALSDSIGMPIVFQTEVVNEKDMEELTICAVALQR